ncbi:PucR family transcriptional regulator [Streptomyces sp. NPDC056165]|uniref:PucR family transcriptional regulator n=1 Tax=Streptomyces sp. NPDC056165 TaxID=3345733 RepID=UPI0035D98EE9
MQLSDVATIPGLALRLITGARYLDRLIRWVYTTDLLESRRYLSGGEIVLTSTTWRRGPEDSEHFVDGLAEGGAVALMAGTAQLGAMPHDLVLACERHRMPLFQVPDDVSFGAITEAVIGRLHEERTAGLKQMVSRHRRLLAGFTHGDGLTEALDLLHNELGIDCWTMSLTGRVSSGSCPYSLPVRLEAVRQALTATRLPVVRETDEGPVTLLALTAGVAPQAPMHLLACASDMRTWSATERETVEEVAEFATAALARQDDRTRQRRDSLGRLTAMLHKEDGDLAEAAALAHGAGLDLGRRHVVLRAQPAEAGNETPGELARQVLAELVAHLGPDSVTAPEAGGAVAVVPLAAAGSDSRVRAETNVEAGGETTDTTPDLEYLRRQLRLFAPVLRGSGLSVGVGRPGEGVRGLRCSSDEAHHAALAAQRRSDGLNLVGIDELDTFDVLLAGTPDALLRSYCRRVLGPILDYDARNRTDLLDSLAAYLAASGSWRAAAASMHVHINTLRYRIHRVEELTSRDLSQWRDRLDFQLALEISRDWLWADRK